MKVYISGKITDDPEYKEHFDEVYAALRRNGYTVLNPTVLPAGLEYEEYMYIGFAMIDVCDAVCFLDNWSSSPGAIREYHYAVAKRKLKGFEHDINFWERAANYETDKHR